MDDAEQRNEGLYIPSLEIDSCGVGLVASIDGISSHQNIQDALLILENMEHRGATGAEENEGDGAGIMMNIPDAFFRKWALQNQISLPEPSHYGVAVLFLPVKETALPVIWNGVHAFLSKHNISCPGIRSVPQHSDLLGSSARNTEPLIFQLILTHKDLSGNELEKKLKSIQKGLLIAIQDCVSSKKEEVCFASISSKTIVYKGQLTPKQIRSYYPDLMEPEMNSAFAIVHARFATNTHPQWRLAQPMNYLAHNGEINTIKGNLKEWEAIEQKWLAEPEKYANLYDQLPICSEQNSDSGHLDSVLGLLIHLGYSIEEAIMKMIPEAHENQLCKEENIAAAYQYFATQISPWDGPAAVLFSDGEKIGAIVDRNGLRPVRYCITKDQRLILGSEAGSLPIPASSIKIKSSLKPGEMITLNLTTKNIHFDREIKENIASQQPYQKWNEKKIIPLQSLIKSENTTANIEVESISTYEKMVYGFGAEDQKIIVDAMLENQKEPIGSMGLDIPLAVLSEQAQHISHYFKQEFAQVTNPAIDPIREKSYMSLTVTIGPGTDPSLKNACPKKRIALSSPLLSESQFQLILNNKDGALKVRTIKAYFLEDDNSEAMRKSIRKWRRQAAKFIREGAAILIIDDTIKGKRQIPIPTMMICGAVHQYLIQKGLRTKVGLVVKGHDCWETHHFACLLSYGADAAYPALVADIIREKVSDTPGISAQKLTDNYFKASNDGLLKIMSKLGISTMSSYKGAQTFEAIGIAAEVIKSCFKGTISRIGGMTFDLLEREARMKHSLARELQGTDRLTDAGIYQWKKTGEYHLFNPQSIHLLQHSTRTENFEVFKQYTYEIDRQDQKSLTLRSLLGFNEMKAIPLGEVEPEENILKRFVTGAMSLGSISEEAHQALAIAMNRIGGKSNCGEGGESAERYKSMGKDSSRSAIKQVASGRFGVTIEYLTHADELQIKIAQGAKPGEGGQLPGHKVDDYIAKLRHATPGIGLISPPPHHDIYSIEDLAQLIFDLKNANPKARISVKLVAKAGVGIIASGVAKAKAEHILISGCDGGTGASPLSSIRHAGIPWELGLAETHQVLLRNRLRNQVVLQCDGQIRTGKDMVIATLLGAQEWGIATAALVVEGCILMRKCHLNTCPVGIATQDPGLRKHFNGNPEQLECFFRFLARDFRAHMAELGFRTVDEMVGRTDLLKSNTAEKHWKIKSLNLDALLFQANKVPVQTSFNPGAKSETLAQVLDVSFIEAAKRTIQADLPVKKTFHISTTNRSAGTLLSNKIVRAGKYGILQEDSITYHIKGSAGQSFGAFLAPGVHLKLEGEANDYFGKGLSGGKLSVYPDADADYDASTNTIAGNVALYGATAGEAYIRGIAGERFAVRNSGAIAVTEGVGDHACEYMTGGICIILGKTGKNFAAGMSGGMAFVLDEDGLFLERCNFQDLDTLRIPLADESTIIQFLRYHIRYTQSTKAQTILRHWNIYKSKFIKVIPTAYHQLQVSAPKIVLPLSLRTY
jgi:glutamate synthase (NADPH/NADH) large chain